MLNAKKGSAWIAVILLLLLLTGCWEQERTLNSNNPAVPEGYLSKEVYLDPNGFQDYTDYCKFSYESCMKEWFAENELYIAVKDDDIDEIIEYFDDFSLSMKASERMDEYDFQKECISAGDYIYFAKSNLKYNYTVYFYDVETAVLYYIHNNV